MQKRITKYLEDEESQATALDRTVLVFWTDGNSRDHKNLYYTRSSDYGNDFGNIIDIFQNYNDSSNVETAFNDSNLYGVWHEGVSGNLEIFLWNSSDGGVTFGQTINISNNRGSSECPSISISNNKLHMVWEDDTVGNHEIYCKSIFGNYLPHEIQVYALQYFRKTCKFFSLFIYGEQQELGHLSLIYKRNNFG